MVFFPVVAVVTVLSYVLAAPVNVPRALPTPVSVATAKTYLAARKSQIPVLYIQTTHHHHVGYSDGGSGIELSGIRSD